MLARVEEKGIPGRRRGGGSLILCLGEPVLFTAGEWRCFTPCIHHGCLQHESGDALCMVSLFMSGSPRYCMLMGQ